MMPFKVSGVIEPTPLRPTYRGGLLLVSLVMLVLPAIYVALVAGAAVAVWWHITSNTWLVGSSTNQFRILAYLAPAIVGIVVVFFMVKPVLARPASRRQPMLVQPNDQPELFAFIREVCSQVRAPVPGRVQLDCQVNASASLGAGPLNLRQRDLVLTIGMPLVAGLSVRQLGGVLAHEFGHFAQGGGMRLTTLIRGVNAWFARVVFERDHWDQKLDELVERRRLALDNRVSNRLGVDRAVETRAAHADDRRARRQLFYDAADGIRRRQLRNQVRRQRRVCRNVCTDAPAWCGGAVRLRRSSRGMAEADAAR